MRHWCHRFVLAYLLIYNAPGPIWVIPKVSEAFDAAEQVVVVEVGRRAFGVELTVFPNGSGDTTYNYVELAFELALGLVVATGWHLWQRRRPVSPRTQDHVTMLVRFVLGATMLSYGWAKVFPNQMPAPGPDRLLNPIGDTSPMGLLWTFMGASAAYQIFAGIGEVVGGTLLFWRRTALLGALVLVGVLANVVALNFCYDVPVKLYSSHLLGMALFVLAPHLPRLLNVLVLNRPAAACELRPFPLQRRWVRGLALAAKAAFVLAYGVYPIYESYQQAQQYGYLSPRHDLAGVYRVTAFSSNGQSGGAVADGQRWVRVGIARTGQFGTVLWADGTVRRGALRIDPANKTIALQRPGGAPLPLRFTRSNAGVVTIEGTGPAGPLTAVLSREPEQEMLLLGRGFHWINEFPFNR
jgi:uncharacterized membrane protein YphA (DoxX/SURF4 family)